MDQRSLKPNVSVVITAYNRREFLLEAVRSAMNQTLREEYYEIIVVKNFYDAEIDEFLAESHITPIFSTKENLVEFTIEGIQAASGDIIMFLDDDDRFLLGKLKTVSRLFHDHERLIYLHNNFYEIDDSGKRRKNHILKQIKKEVKISTSQEDLKYNSHIFRYYTFYNMSCISIKREPFIGLFSKYKELLREPSDFHFYILALLSGEDVMFSDAFLTEYRVHANSRTFGNSFYEKKFIERIKNDKLYYMDLSSKLRGTFAYPLLLFQSLENLFNEYIYVTDFKKPSVKELLTFSYYSIKRRNRIYLLLILLTYFRVVSKEEAININLSRRSMRINDN